MNPYLISKIDITTSNTKIASGKHENPGNRVFVFLGGTSQSLLLDFFWFNKEII